MTGRSNVSSRMAQVLSCDAMNAVRKPDLLQRALQNVIDEEQENKYVIALESAKTPIPTHTMGTVTTFGMNDADKVIYEQCRNSVAHPVTTSIPSTVVQTVSVNNMTNQVQKQQQYLYAQQQLQRQRQLQQQLQSQQLQQRQERQNSWATQQSRSVTQINFAPVVIQPCNTDINTRTSENSQSQKSSNNLLILNANSVPLGKLNLLDCILELKVQSDDNSSVVAKQSDNPVWQAPIVATNDAKAQKVKANRGSKKSSSSYCVKTATKNRYKAATTETEKQILQKLPKILPLTTPNAKQAGQTLNVLRTPIKTISNIIHSNQVVNASTILMRNQRSPSNQAQVLASRSDGATDNDSTSVSMSPATTQIPLSIIKNHPVTISTDVWKHLQIPSQIFLNRVPSTSVIGNKTTTTTSMASTTPPLLTNNPLNVQKIKSTFKNLPNSVNTKRNPRSVLKTIQTSSLQAAALQSTVKNAAKSVGSQKVTLTMQNESNSTNTLPDGAINELKTVNTNRNSTYVMQNASAQPLSDTQLKQIRQALDQHSPDAETKDQLVLYRVVSLEDVGIKNSGTVDTLSSTSASTSSQLLSSTPMTSHNHVDTVPEKNQNVAKRGRPKKNAIQSHLFPPKPVAAAENEQENSKDKQVSKVVARTRSGRLSRLPKYIANDYKRLPFDKHLTSVTMNSNNINTVNNENLGHNKQEGQNSPFLLDGLDIPKRNISDRFKCPTCTKCYLGQSRMLSHFEKCPDHGIAEQIARKMEPTKRQSSGTQDPLKRKGKKRGPWAYATPEAKSRRRQEKLQEAMAVCEREEIIKVVEKKLDVQSLFELIAKKYDDNASSFLDYAKLFGEQMREKTNATLMPMNVSAEKDEKTIALYDERLAIYLGIDPGVYKINDKILNVEFISRTCDEEVGSSPKNRKTNSSEGGEKENNEERVPSRASEIELGVPEFHEGRAESMVNPTCPTRMPTLTLISGNPAPSSSTSNVLISSSEIQSRLSDDFGFQRVDINAPKVSSYEESNAHDTFVHLNNVVIPSDIQDQFHNVAHEYGRPSLVQMLPTYKLESANQNFIVISSSYRDQDSLEKTSDKLNIVSRSFAKDYHNSDSMNSSELSPIEASTAALHNIYMSSKSVPNISDNCDSSAFENTRHLDISKVSNYLLDNMTTSTSNMSKNLTMDHSSDNSNTNLDVPNIDVMSHEPLQNIMSENILETNLQDNSTSYPILDFEQLTVDDDFGGNTNT